MLDVQRFVSERRPAWQRLEELLGKVERGGMRSLSLEEGRAFVRLYRAASSHLVHARATGAPFEVVDYLNALVARAYAEIYRAERPRLSSLWTFFAVEFPRLVRAEWRALMSAFVILLGAASLGFVLVSTDPRARFYLLPDEHAYTDPASRVKKLESGEKRLSAHEQAMFSSYLFTHNIQVTFLVFALGITFGVGTALTLFYNGLMLGAVCADYHARGVAMFFYAWILPHGVLELAAVAIGAAGGLKMGYALANPGRYSRGIALRQAATVAVRLVLGVIPILVVAGLIEGTLSQLNPPEISYEAKLLFAASVGVLLAAYLVFGGRKIKVDVSQG